MDYARIIYSEISFVPSKSTSNGTGNSNGNNNNIGNGSNGAADTNGLGASSSSSSKICNNHNGNSESSKINFNSNGNRDNNNRDNNDSGQTFQLPQQKLYDANLLKLDWLHPEKVGVGLINVGNTCFLNSVLQCLTYCPPLYNYLVKSNGGHSDSCKLNTFCMLCEMEKHIKRIRNSNGTPIKPLPIFHRLKYINRSFQFGRQEDAHEFLRYLIDHMWKACLLNLDINCKTSKLDARVKETTAINHIFGGYHRSQVLCLSCNSRSNTFDFFMDFMLDIRSAKSLEDALRKFSQPETLANENAYKCGKCKKKVLARKRFSVYRAPNVATFQLKRFDSDRIFGGKITKTISYPEELDLRPYMSDSNKPPILYNLNSVLVHTGHSSNSGHYFCFIKNSNGLWYRMDDSSVTSVNKNVVLHQQAYVLFYTKKVTGVQKPSNGISHEKVLSSTKSAIANSNSNDINNSNNVIKRQATSSPSTNATSRQQAQSLPAVASTSNGTTRPIERPLATWLGTKSKLEEDDSGKRKLNEMSERDRFNEELDQGRVKKINLLNNRFEKFTNLSKSNPFQRFTSNGYRQLNR